MSQRKLLDNSLVARWQKVVARRPQNSLEIATKSPVSQQSQGRSRVLKKLKNVKKVKRGPTNQPTNRRTDIAGYRVARTRLKTKVFGCTDT